MAIIGLGCGNFFWLHTLAQQTKYLIVRSFVATWKTTVKFKTMKYLNVLVIVCVFPLIGISQDQNDKKLVMATAQSWFNSFNNHNYDDFFDYITEDCFGINPMGKYMRMTNEAPTIFNKGHEGLLKNLSIEVDSIDVRFIESDVAIATVFSREKGAIYPPDGIDRGNNKVDGQGLITTMIIVKRNKKWLITQYQSTHIPNP